MCTPAQTNSPRGLVNIVIVSLAGILVCLGLAVGLGTIIKVAVYQEPLFFLGAPRGGPPPRPADVGYSSPHLESAPHIGDACASDDLAHVACDAGARWLVREARDELEAAQFVHYALLRANESLIVGTAPATPLTRAYAACAATGAGARACVEVAALSHPLSYCRRIKNGAGEPRAHHARLARLLARVVGKAAASHGLPPDATLAGLCDPWRGRAGAGPVAATLLATRVFHIRGRVVTAPTQALLYTEPEWDADAGDAFWSFQLAHELAHEVVPLGADTEAQCDALAASWVLPHAGGREAMAAVAQLLCMNDAWERVTRLGRVPEVARTMCVE